MNTPSIFNFPAAASNGSFELRQMTARDLAAVATHFLNLDEDDRVQRFHSPLSNAAIMSYVSALDLNAIGMVGAIDNVTGAVIGLAELHAVHGKDNGEVAMSVTLGARENLVATQLLSQILDLAALRGVDELEFHMHPENTWLAEVLRAFGAEIDSLRGHAKLTWRDEDPFLASAAA